MTHAANILAALSSCRCRHCGTPTSYGINECRPCEIRLDAMAARGIEIPIGAPVPVPITSSITSPVAVEEVTEIQIA